MNCPNCQKVLQGDFKFCPYCGVEIKKNLSCPSCGNKAEPAWVSCPYCGEALRGTAPQQTPLRQMPRPQQHQPYGYHYGSSSGRKHRKRKGFLGKFFSS